MNSVQIKFQSIVISLTTLIFFSLYEAANKAPVQINPILKVLVGVALSLSLYRLITKQFLKLGQKSEYVRKFMLGSMYMEGTWVGFYVGISGKVRYLVEHYEQDFFQLIIRGDSWDEEGKFHTSWRSKPAHINSASGQISYMYDLSGINDNTNGDGIAFFNFIRKNQYSAPTELKGFSADLHNSSRTKSIEKKISDNHRIDDIKALTIAMEFYKERGNLF